MQDRYAGDVGDFSKYALLRQMVRHTSWRCGLVWYRYPCERHNNDGLHTRYDLDRRFRGCDDQLVELLGPIGRQSERSIVALEQAPLLPANTTYFAEAVHWDKDRADNRKAWFDRAKATVSGCQLVMVDPDNGIAEPERFVQNSSKAGKHIQLREIKELASQCECLVVYHHLCRDGSHKEQITRWLSRLRSVVSANVFALRYRPYSPRAYFVLSMNPGAANLARGAADGLVRPPWDQHFELYT